MKILPYTAIEPTQFDGDAVKGVAARVMIGKKDGADHFCMRVFELSIDGYTPRHSHPWEHEIFVHSGNGAVLDNGAWKEVKSGDVVFIPGEEEHQIKNCGSTPFVFVCLIPSGAPEI